MRNNSVKFGPVVHEMSFNDISYLELWQPLYSAKQNHLCIIDRSQHEEQLCEIVLNLDYLFRRRCRLSRALAAPVSWSIFLVKGIIGNNSVKLF